MKIKDIPVIDRPREKLIKYGPEKLNNAELLAIVLGKGKKGTNAIELAKKILKKITWEKFTDLKLVDLKNISGIGKTKACQVVACFELGKRFLKGKKSTFIMTPKEVWRDLKDIRNNKKEHFIALYLDVRNQVIVKEIISIGTLNASLVHPREVFEPAIRNLAAQIILSHNHPSGDPSASEEDIKLTRQLIEAGKILGIEIIDHVIVSEKGFVSMKEKALM